MTVTSVSVPKIQSLIRPDEILVEYFEGGGLLYAFLVTPEDLKGVRLESAGIAQLAQEFRTSLEDPGSERFAQLSQDLFDRLIKPIEPYLRAPNLLIVPHGFLHYVPFQALKGEDGFLVDRYGLRYLPSASVMSYLKGRKTKSDMNLIALGNPELGERRVSLAYAEEEAKSVARAFPESTVLVGKQASETTFRKAAGTFAYIHLATHGRFDSQSPLTSGLFLAEDAENDGLLTVGELYTLRLNTELVTLSACETGLSAIGNGDDLVGLARGFFYAGSQAILASLWSVDDEATSYLMSKFYAGLKTMNKRDALRAAQRAAKEKYPHPFYWAAFQLTGQIE